MDQTELYNGVQLPLIGLGTWDLRGDKCVDIITAAIEDGYRLIDTAQMYENEEEVGEGVRRSGISRNEIFLTTKIDGRSQTYEKAEKSINDSLQKIGTDYVDLLLLHEPYRGRKEMYRAIEDAYKAGKARAIGISNFDESHFAKFTDQCRIIPMVNQVECHVFFQRSSLLKTEEHYHTRMQAWSPLAAGKDNIVSHPLLTEIGRRYNKTAAQTALRFLVQQSISVIPKTSHVGRLKENMALFDFSLNESEMEAVRKLDRKETLFSWTNEY